MVKSEDRDLKKKIKVISGIKKSETECHFKNFNRKFQKCK